MACLINAKSTGVGGIDASGDASGVLALQTGGTTAVTIDASQNVGIGVTPSAWASGYNAIQFGGSGRSSALFTNGANDLWQVSNTYFNGTNFIYNSTGTATGYEQTNGAHIWTSAISGTAGGTVSFTERMRIDSSGNVLVACTGLPTGGVGGISLSSPATSNGMILGTTGTGATNMIRFYNPNGNVGAITTSGSLTTYAVSSDYRLKENIAPMIGALNTVAQLKPVTYDWISDKSQGQGFIAHELAEVVPDCVTGAKDAVDAEGNPQYQGIDTSFLVGTLTCAIQELKAIIDTQQQIMIDLNTRITALEAK